MAGFFGFFDYTKPGKGVSKEELQKTGIALYFDIFFRRFWKLVTLNLLYLVASIPAIAISWFISTYVVTWLASIAEIEISGEWLTSLSLLSLFVTIVFLQICGSGPASAGMSYVLRKYVNDTHSWVWSDFVDNVKSNFRQALLVYIINVVLVCLCVVSFVFYSQVMQGFAALFLRTIVFIAAALFLMMQMYTYQLMVSFELKLKDIYRNSFILVMAKLPWNVVTAAVTGMLMYAVFSLSMYIPIAGVAVVLALFYTVINFTQIFMTNNIIRKYVLEPAEKASPQAEPIYDEPDFEDVRG